MNMEWPRTIALFAALDAVPEFAERSSRGNNIDNNCEERKNEKET